MFRARTSVLRLGQVFFFCLRTRVFSYRKSFFRVRTSVFMARTSVYSLWTSVFRNRTSVILVKDKCF